MSYWRGSHVSTTMQTPWRMRPMGPWAGWGGPMGLARTQREPSPPTLSARRPAHTVGPSVLRAVIEREAIQLRFDIRRAEIVDADAEQADRAPAGVGFLAQSKRASRQVRFVPRRRGGVTPRDRREVGVSHLDRHRAREQLLAREPADRGRGHLRDLVADGIDVDEIFGIGVLTAG